MTSRAGLAEVLLLVSSATPEQAARAAYLARRVPGLTVHLVGLDGRPPPPPAPLPEPPRPRWPWSRRGGVPAPSADPAAADATASGVPHAEDATAATAPIDRWYGPAHRRLRAAVAEHPEVEAVVVGDEGVTGLAWTFAGLDHHRILVLDGVEAAARLLAWRQAGAMPAPDLSPLGLRSSRDDFLYAALGQIGPRRPRVVVAAADDADGPDLARAVHDELGGAADVVAVVPTTDRQGLAPDADRSVLVARVDPAELAGDDALRTGLGADAVVAVAADLAEARVAVAEVLRGATESGAPDAAPRLLIGPANYAGQGAAWARAVDEHLPGARAQNLQVASPQASFLFAADVPMGPADWVDPIVRARAAADALLPATHVLVESLRPVLGASIGRGTGAHPWDVELGVDDARALHASGRRVGVVLHGSEARRPTAHAARYQWSPFGRAEFADETRRRTAHTDAVHALLDTLDPAVFPRFVSTPDVLEFVPGSVWLPVTLAPGCFRPTPPALQRPRPVVVHAPTSDVFKGTDRIDPVLEALAAAGRIEYRRLRGVAPSAVMGYLREADVLVDQVTLGNPGVLAAQAMACGRLVVAHLAPHVRELLGVGDLVVEAGPTDLGSVLEAVLADRPAAAARAAEGAEFARALHDGRRSADVLAPFLGVAAPGR